MKNVSPLTNRRGFTLIELLTVIAIIIILMGLVISVAGFVQDKAARDRSKSEIAAFETAMESYKADNGIYPQDTDSDTLARETSGLKTFPKLSSAYKKSSLVLYKALSGDTDANGSRSGTELDNKPYFEFQTKKSMLEKSGSSVTAIIDPWGNSYGYSTAVALSIANDTPPDYTKGYNPTFDLWSTANQKSSEDANPAKWVKNW